MNNKENTILEKDNILDNFIEPEMTVQYFFIEKADEQIEMINKDQ